jgi:hypothetical protein
MCSGIPRPSVLKERAEALKSLRFTSRVGVSLHCIYYTRLQVNLSWLATMSGAAIISQFVLTFRPFVSMAFFL